MLALLTQLSLVQLKTPHKMTAPCLAGEHHPEDSWDRGSLFQAPEEKLGDTMDPTQLWAPCCQYSRARLTHPDLICCILCPASAGGQLGALRQGDHG